MTNEEFQQQIEQMLSVQRSLQESDLRRIEQLRALTGQLENLTQQMEVLGERQMQTDEQIIQLVQLMRLQGERFALMTEALGLQNDQIKNIYGRLDILENPQSNS